MKKLYILLSSIAYISSDFAANSPAFSDYDCCDREIPPTYPAQVAEVGNTVGVSAAISMRAWGTALRTPSQSSPAAVLPTSVNSALLNQTIVSDLKFAKLKLYCPTFIEKREALNKRQLQEKYDTMEAGQHFYAIYKPEIHLISRSLNSDISLLDSVAWVAKVRAWVKWWLNPWAWRKPDLYSLTEGDKIIWDDSTLEVSVNIDKNPKDISYISSQLRQFLLKVWGARYYPYIVPSTRLRFEGAVRLRFENVEKSVLEAVGFKDVTLKTRVNLTTQRLEYYVQAAK